MKKKTMKTPMKTSAMKAMKRESLSAGRVGRCVKRDGRGRGLPRQPDDIRQLKISDLRSRLHSIGLDKSGRKAELVTRLEAAVEADNVAVGLPVVSEAARAEEVHLPRDFLSQHHSLFYLSDAQKQPSVCWWFGMADGDARQPVLHTVLKAHHEVVDTAVGKRVRDTAVGNEEVKTFSENNPQLKRIGICFSHHSRSTCKPTHAEVKTLFDLAKSEFPSEVILGVMWRQGVNGRGGFSVWRLAQTQLAELEDRKGELAHSQDTLDYLEEVRTTSDGPEIVVVRRGELIGRNSAPRMTTMRSGLGPL